MPVLVSDIVADVINELSQVPGTATQLYATPRITQHVQDALLLELEEMWWPDYMAFITTTLDGTSGLLTTDLVGPLGAITEYHDIAKVWPAQSNKALSELPYGMNPNTLTSGSAMFMAADYTVTKRPFRVWPKSATGDLVVWARQRPKIPISTTDLLYIDRLLLQYDATWMYCVDDGTVPAQVQKFQMLAANRRKQMKSAFAQQSLMLDPRDPTGVDQWWAAP